MQFDLVKASADRGRLVEQQHYDESNGIELNETILMQIILINSLKNNENIRDKILENPNYDPTNIDIKLTCNGIEVDLIQGLKALVDKITK